MKRLTLIALIGLSLAAVKPVGAQQKLNGAAIQNQGPTQKKLKVPKSGVIELDTIRIEGRIYEPEVLFILDQPSIDLMTIKEKREHDFLRNLEAPLRDMR